MFSPILFVFYDNQIKHLGICIILFAKQTHETVTSVLLVYIILFYVWLALLDLLE